MRTYLDSMWTQARIYRCVAFLFIFFAIRHTTGVLGTKDLPKEALDMRTAMFATHFGFMGADSTCGGFYEGFGLGVTLFLLFCGWIAWTLGGMQRDNARAARPIAGVFWSRSFATPSWPNIISLPAP